MRSLTIPPGWQVRRLKFASTINDEALPESTPPDLGISYVDIGDVTSEGQITGATEYRFEQAPSRARRKVRDGDVIVSTVRTYLRAIAPVHDPESNLIVSTGFAVVRPTILDTSFAAYALRAQNFVDLVVAASTGVSYPAINASTLGELPVLVPPLATQRAIAAFLDHETAKIDALIEKKRRLLDLLDEKRSALITRAVTRGLDRDVPMRDSGVEWLGEIPAHWDVLPLKRILGPLVTGTSVRGNTSESAAQGSIGVLKTSSVYGDEFRSTENKAVDREEEDRVSCPVVADSLIVSRMNTPDLVGSCAYVSEDHPNLFLPDRLWRTRARPQVCEGRFMWMIMRSRSMRAHLSLLATGASASMRCLAQEDFLGVSVGLPPLHEQRAILGHLEENLDAADRATTKIVEAISLLHEYRAALISATVSGQVDISEAGV